MTLLTIAALVGAVVIGVIAYLRLGTRGGTLRDALAVLRAGFLILVGIGLIAGGFLVAGAVVVALFTFTGIGAAASVEEDVRDRLAY